MFLVGFMGSGKTTVGRLLADIMSYQFLDLDRRIERSAAQTIPELFERRGEAGFRELEHAALQAVAGERSVIVATGGGAMASARNRELMAASGTTVWLNPSFATMARRVREQEAVPRPLFTDPDEAARLFEARLGGYRQADLELEIGAGEEAGVVAQRVADLLRGEPCAT